MRAVLNTHRERGGNNTIADDEILRILKEQFEHTKKRYQEARENFWRAVQSAELPEGKVQIRIRRALTEENRAQREHMNSIIRLNRFLLSEMIPKDAASDAIRAKRFT